MEEKRRQIKMQSRKFWFTVWGASYATIIPIIAILKGYDATWIGISIPLAISIVVAYVGIGRLKEPKQEIK